MRFLTFCYNLRYMYVKHNISCLKGKEKACFILKLETLLAKRRIHFIYLFLEDKSLET